AEDDRTAHAGRAHDRAAEDLTQVVEYDQAAFFGRLDHTGVRVGPEREPVRPADTTRQQRLDGLRDVRRIVGEVVARDGRLHLLRLGDADDARRRPAVEDGDVLGFGNAARGVVGGIEIDVDGAAVEIAQRGAGNGEVGAQLRERLHAPLPRLRPGNGR